MDWILQERLRDAAGVAWNTGSGWIIRKSALQATSGFPESCVLEDVYSSMLMLSRGWRTVYVAEALQWGLVPESYDAHVRQFTRWVSWC